MHQTAFSHMTGATRTEGLVLLKSGVPKSEVDRLFQHPDKQVDSVSGIGVGFGKWLCGLIWGPYSCAGQGESLVVNVEI